MAYDHATPYEATPDKNTPDETGSRAAKRNERRPGRHAMDGAARNGAGKSRPDQTGRTGKQDRTGKVDRQHGGGRSAAEWLMTDVGSLFRSQKEKDEDNDSTDTGTFPVVKATKRTSGATATRNALLQKIVTSVLIILMCMLLGFGYVTQQRNTNENYQSLSEDELVRLLDETTTQVDRLEEQRTTLRSQVDSITNSTDKQAQLNEVAKQNATVSGILAGRIACHGSGVRITIAETGTHIDSARLFTVIEELRNAGAEAIAFDGVRITASSYVVDTDEGVEVDGTIVGTPYDIKAIGSPSALANAIQISGGIGSQLRVRYNANVTVTQLDDVVIDELAAAKTYQYAKIVE
ncbi:MAG: DUF881 domain-containing protein [Pseudoscardovia radai]|nr:DUF881 domain-containing protein [Pseudoscardovia radai]